MRKEVWDEVTQDLRWDDLLSIRPTVSQYIIFDVMRLMVFTYRTTTESENSVTFFAALINANLIFIIIIIIISVIFQYKWLQDL